MSVHVDPEKAGVKHDADKLRWDLLPSDALEPVVKVLMFGAKKYDSWNWARGMNQTRLFSACMRHLWAWFRGEDCDPESGLPHLAHAMCCLLFMIGLVNRGRTDCDDRPALARITHNAGSE